MRVSRGIDQCLEDTNISTATFLDMSLPFRPAFMNASPVHRIMEYEAAKARPLNAVEANIGAPSSPQLLYKTLKEAADSANNEYDSVLLSWAVICIYCREYNVPAIRKRKTHFPYRLWYSGPDYCLLLQTVNYSYPRLPSYFHMRRNYGRHRADH